jgi:hypothetical protein
MVKERKTTAIANYDEEFAKHAAAYAGMESSAALGSFFKLRGGQLTFQDAPVPGNRMAVVILDHVLENVWYDKDFDPDSPSSPACYAFGRDERSLAPHEEAPDKQAETCAVCPKNAWGSDPKGGRGKACSNTRRLALIPAGSISASGAFEARASVDDFANAPMAFLKIPVTSVKGFAGFVQQTASALKRPPFGLFTKVSVVPDAKVQFRVQFEPLEAAPKPLAATLFKRHEDAASKIIFAYPAFEESTAPMKGRGKKGHPAKGAPPKRRPAPSARPGASRY